MRRTASLTMLILLISNLLVLGMNVQLVRGFETIYIRADGTLDPPTAPIQRNGNIYTLTDNIMSDANGIIIERDNITIDGSGYNIQGPEADYDGDTPINGIYLFERINVTITNICITNFSNGIMLEESSNCKFLNNFFQNNNFAVNLAKSQNNTIIRNQLIGDGIHFWPYSINDTIVENLIVNDYEGIIVYNPGRISIYNNTITNSSYGISLYFGGHNVVSNNTLSNAGLRIHGSYENKVENNTVNGKPLVHFEKTSDHIVEDAGQVILVNCTNITVKNLNLSNTSYPMQLWDTNNSRIINNTIAENNWNGIQLYFSSNNTLEGNNVTGNLYHGVHFYASSYNTLRNNHLTVENYFNFFIDGMTLSHFINDIDTSNTVNDKPIIYWASKTGSQIPQEAGSVILANCTRMTIQNLNLTGNAQAIVLAYTKNSSVTQNNFAMNEYSVYLHMSQKNNVTRNTMTNDWYGVYLRNSSENMIRENSMLINNYGIFAFYSSSNYVVENSIAAWYGILLGSSSNNYIFHNNFLGTTTHQVSSGDAINFWDDGYFSGGNYWSNYNGTDVHSGLYQNETGSDGIGDTPYIIDGNNSDNYPLIYQWLPYIEVPIKGGEDTVIQSNVTVVNALITLNTLHFDVFGPSGSVGWITVVLPMINRTNIKVFFNRTRLVPPPWPSISDNATHYFVYFEFNLSYHDVIMKFWWPYDVTEDDYCGIDDIVAVASKFGTEPGHTNWHPVYDINDDDYVGIDDIVLVAEHFGESA